MQQLEQSISPYNALSSVQLSRLLFQQYSIRCICLAARLGIADLLGCGGMSVADIANKTKSDEQGLYRMLRHLASIDIFSELPERRFENSAMSECLRSDVSDSVRPLALFLEEDWHRHVWDNLAVSVETGASAFDHVYGMNLFTWVADKPKSADVLLSFAAAFSASSFPPVLHAYDYSWVQVLVDIGAGLGNDIAMLLAAYPALEAVCFELPLPCERARKNLHGKQLEHRARFVPGDMFESIPPGGDLYLLKQIFHNWPDPDVHRLLRNCHRAMGGRGRLLIAEFVIDAGAPMDTAFAQLVDVWMMVLTSGGRNRTLAEHRRNLEECGFTVTRVIPTGSPQTLIEAIPKTM